LKLKSLRFQPPAASACCYYFLWRIFQQREAVICRCVRIAMGRRDGILKGWQSVDLPGHTLRGLIDRAASGRKRLTT